MEAETLAELALPPFPSPPNVEQLVENRKWVKSELLKQAWTVRTQLISDIIEVIKKKALDYSVFTVIVTSDFDEIIWANKCQHRAFSDIHPKARMDPWILDHFKKAYDGRASVGWASCLVGAGYTFFGYTFDFRDSMPGEEELVPSEISQWENRPKDVATSIQHHMVRKVPLVIQRRIHLSMESPAAN